jgi:LacI family transcriptional regulator
MVHTVFTTNKGVLAVSKRVKLSDIAHKSGVSISTVSLALRDKPSIPSETRRRILNTAKELGYHPQKSTARPRPTLVQLHSLGLVVKLEPDLAPQANPFYSHVLVGIEEACRQKKINLLYATLPVDENNHPIEVPYLLLEESADGLLLVGALVDGALAPVLQQKAVPIVLVDAYALSDRHDAVVSDNVQGACQAVSHLIQRGHRHIGLVGSCPDGYPSLRERRQGYIQALKEHNLTETFFGDCVSNKDAAFEATIQLLSQYPQVTAVFGCNDEMALAVMRAAQAIGRQVPKDLSVIGFDDIDLAQHVTPSLTTMHVDKVAMGRMAVQLLINRVEFPDTEPVTLVIHPRLIERESVATPT